MPRSLRTKSNKKKGSIYNDLKGKECEDSKVRSHNNVIKRPDIQANAKERGKAVRKTVISRMHFDTWTHITKIRKSDIPEDIRPIWKYLCRVLQVEKKPIDVSDFLVFEQLCYAYIDFKTTQEIQSIINPKENIELYFKILYKKQQQQRVFLHICAQLGLSTKARKTLGILFEDDTDSVKPTTSINAEVINESEEDIVDAKIKALI